MNRPEGISESAWEKADAVLLESPAFMIPTATYQATQVLIAKVIQSSVEAEREACADRLMAIAKATPLGYENIQRGKSTYNWLQYAADLVRKGA